MVFINLNLQELQSLNFLKMRSERNEKGQALRLEIFRTPVDGARLSYTIGHSRHPSLEYTKLHKGIDFATPRGSPVMAKGNGVLVRASFCGSYGNYILILHDSGYQI
jgi:murein DD-endopeptidase MepM/ murein hydrolase activator NlpD